jgi:hypothetical protein
MILAFKLIILLVGVVARMQSHDKFNASLAEIKNYYWSDCLGHKYIRVRKKRLSVLDSLSVSAGSC